MRTSKQGIDLIKHFEGFRSEAYRCPAGVWTIGYGHTAGVCRGDVVASEQLAEQWLADDLQKAEAAVGRNCPAINQNRFDALVSFTFNLGERNLLRSTLLKRLKANPDDPCIRAEFLRWNRANGQVLDGLTRRRKAEADLYFA